MFRILIRLFHCVRFERKMLYKLQKLNVMNLIQLRCKAISPIIQPSPRKEALYKNATSSHQNKPQNALVFVYFPPTMWCYLSNRRTNTRLRTARR